MPESLSTDPQVLQQLDKLAFYKLNTIWQKSYTSY